VLQVAVFYTLSASQAESNGRWRFQPQCWLASWQIAIRLANEGKLLCRKFPQVCQPLLISTSASKISKAANLFEIWSQYKLHERQYWCSISVL
jgi:hypothetical protein